MMRYPPPAYALQCWFTEGKIRIAVPPSQPGGKGHCIDVECDADGVKTLMFLLKQRVTVKDARIGSPGVPTQEMLNALNTQIKLTTVVPKNGPRALEKKTGALSLEDLGL